MQLELLKSEIMTITERPFFTLNPQAQRQTAIRILRRRQTPAAHFVADQLLRGALGYRFVVSDDVSSLT